MTDERGSTPGDARNPDLEAMHDDLVKLVGTLERAIDGAPDAAAIASISDQIVEVNARATAAGRVLLAAQTDEIARHARAVSSALPSIERDIERLEDFEQVVGGVAAVLDAADEAVRVATLMCR